MVLVSNSESWAAEAQNGEMYNIKLGTQYQVVGSVDFWIISC